MAKSDEEKDYLDDDVDMDGDYDDDLSPTSYGRGRGSRRPIRGRGISRGFRGSGRSRGRGRGDSYRSRGEGYRGRGDRKLGYSSRGRGGDSYRAFSPRGRGLSNPLLKGISELLSSRSRITSEAFGSDSYRGRGRGGRGRSRGRGVFERDFDDRPPKYLSSSYSRVKDYDSSRSYANGLSSRTSRGSSTRPKMSYDFESSRRYDDYDYRDSKYKEELYREEKYRGVPRHRDDFRRSPPPRRIMSRGISPPPPRRLSPPRRFVSPPRRASPRRHFVSPRRMSPPNIRMSSPGRSRYRSRSPIMRQRSFEREDRLRAPRGGPRGWSPRRRSPDFAPRPYKPPTRKESFSEKELFFKGRDDSAYGRPRGYPKADFRPKESYTSGSRY